jgi:hypothetical protein
VHSAPSPEEFLSQLLSLAVDVVLRVRPDDLTSIARPERDPPPVAAGSSRLTGISAGLVPGIAGALTRPTVQLLDTGHLAVLLTSWPAYSPIGVSLVGLWLMESAFNAARCTRPCRASARLSRFAPQGGTLEAGHHLHPKRRDFLLPYTGRVGDTLRPTDGEMPGRIPFPTAIYSS